ncbi:MAG: cell division protein FtsQ/DivIB [Clostridiales bacterium]|nr:cell division protein FtsQ/DivIB [Clostridiales bacterium]
MDEDMWISKDEEPPVKNFSSRLWKWLFCLFLIGFFVWSMFFLFRPDQVTVTGCHYYSDQDIERKMFTSKTDQNTLVFFIKYKFFKEVSIPFVDTIDVELLSYNHVKIRVYEKKMIACVQYMNEYLYFDKDGTIIESSPKRLEDIPLVSGIKFQKMTLYEKLAVKEDGIFDQILNVSQLIEQNELEIDKVVFDVNRNVTLYSGKIAVELGNRENYDDQMAQLPEILKKAKKNKLEGTLDMKDYVAGQKRIIFHQKKTK